MEVVQLQLDLWRSLETAARFPETADLRSLVSGLERAVFEQPVQEQLQVAAEGMLQISEVYAARSEWMISGWQDQHHPQDPVVDLEGYAELFVQSLHLDVADLFEEPEGIEYPEQRRSRELGYDSVAGVVEKGVLLSWVEELDREMTEAELSQQVQDLAHDEPIGEWVGMIQEFLLNRSAGEAISFVGLQRSLGMPWICLWLGLLHGSENWEITQIGGFYEAGAIEVRHSEKQR